VWLSSIIHQRYSLRNWQSHYNVQFTKKTFCRPIFSFSSMLCIFQRKSTPISTSNTLHSSSLLQQMVTTSAISLTLSTQNLTKPRQGPITLNSISSGAYRRKQKVRPEIAFNHLSIDGHIGPPSTPWESKRKNKRWRMQRWCIPFESG